MKTVLNAIVALGLIAGIATSANATPNKLDAKAFFAGLDKVAR